MTAQIRGLRWKVKSFIFFTFQPLKLKDLMKVPKFDFDFDVEKDFDLAVEKDFDLDLDAEIDDLVLDTEKEAEFDLEFDLDVEKEADFDLEFDLDVEKDFDFDLDVDSDDEPEARAEQARLFLDGLEGDLDLVDLAFD